MFAFGDAEWPGLAKVNEEAGEVIQVIGKLMMVHGRSKHWSGDLRQMLVEELADLMAAIDFVVDHLDGPEAMYFCDRRIKKSDLFEQYHRENSGDGDH